VPSGSQILATDLMLIKYLEGNARNGPRIMAEVIWAFLVSYTGGNVLQEEVAKVRELLRTKEAEQKAEAEQAEEQVLVAQQVRII
jgi:hypothetical protein